jgi:hypothetical protein
MPSTEVDREIREREGRSPGIGAHIGREREHARDRQPELRLLLSRERLAESSVGKGLPLLGSTGRVQEDRRLGCELPAERMLGRGQLQRMLAQVRSDPRM